jgi:hypothetical protein
MRRGVHARTRKGAIMTTRKSPKRKAAEPRKSRQSQYDRYPLAFFDRKVGSTWAIESTGNYSKDCEIGHKYAVEFLNSCDGSVGWSWLLASIVKDMIERGRLTSNGVVIGFMGVIGAALCYLHPLNDPRNLHPYKGPLRLPFKGHGPALLPFELSDAAARSERMQPAN